MIKTLKYLCVLFFLLSFVKCNYFESITNNFYSVSFNPKANEENKGLEWNREYQLRSPYGILYECRIPPIKEEYVIPKEEFSFKDLIDLTNNCHLVNTGWWSYQVCHFSSIDQVHFESSQVEKSIKLGEFVKQEIIKDSDEPIIKAEFKFGNYCKESNNLREAIIYYECSYTPNTRPNIQDGIYFTSITEPSMCKYEFKIHIQEFCKYSQKYQQEKQINLIQCTATDKKDLNLENTNAILKEKENIPHKMDFQEIAKLIENLINSYSNPKGDFKLFSQIENMLLGFNKNQIDEFKNYLSENFMPFRFNTFNRLFTHFFRHFSGNNLQNNGREEKIINIGLTKTQPTPKDQEHQQHKINAEGIKTNDQKMKGRSKGSKDHSDKEIVNSHGVKNEDYNENENENENENDDDKNDRFNINSIKDQTNPNIIKELNQYDPVNNDIQIEIFDITTEIEKIRNQMKRHQNQLITRNTFRMKGEDFFNQEELTNFFSSMEVVVKIDSKGNLIEVMGEIKDPKTGKVLPKINLKSLVEVIYQQNNSEENIYATLKRIFQNYDESGDDDGSISPKHS
ncbi:os-9-related [Anaeramoeba flamelloides]|uniref:Os-9-related n=1 Tax=Anaeramoeba flamelloides TaxID=1746091 RepID=A0ABQ8XQZ7_9EUKA|nr:os-9-related [Anaeramoeba flamelloides]